MTSDESEQKIRRCAFLNGMDVIKRTEQSPLGFSYVVIYITPKGYPAVLLLGVTWRVNGWNITKHRTAVMTEKFQNRRVSTDWIANFIARNVEYAKTRTLEHLSAWEEAQGRIRMNQAKAPPRSPGEVAAIRAERIRHRCQCAGEVANCRRCFGSGHYETDGLGNSV